MEAEDKGRKLNWEQAIAVLDCSRSHFYNLVNSGRQILPPPERQHRL